MKQKRVLERWGKDVQFSSELLQVSTKVTHQIIDGSNLDYLYDIWTMYHVEKIINAIAEFENRSVEHQAFFLFCWSLSQT